MKVAFIGNTNNYPFMLALALSRLGCDVTFVIDSSEKLHRPEFYVSKDAIKNIQLIDCPDLIQHFHQYLIPDHKLRKIIRELKNADVVFYNGLWPAISSFVGKQHFVLITGSDLEVYADPSKHFVTYWNYCKNDFFLKRLVKVFISLIVTFKQRQGIASAKGINYFPKGVIPNGDRLLSGLGKKFKRFSFMMTDTSLRKVNLQKINNTGLRVLLTARQTWKMPQKPGLTHLDYKGTDIFLNGLALFIKTKSVPIKVYLVRKGLDIEESEKLIERLDITEHIEWLPEMTQSQLFEFYNEVDVIADQFSNSVVGMAGLDAMAMGKPLLANGRPEIFESIIGVPSPICQASSVEEVFHQLSILSDKDLRTQIGLQSREYVERFFSSDAAARKCLELFK